MTAFKVGDKVKLVSNASSLGILHHDQWYDKELEIVNTDEDDRYDIEVKFGSSTEWLRSVQLVKSSTTYENPSRPYTRTAVQEFNHNCVDYVVTVDSDDNTVRLYKKHDLEQMGWHVKQPSSETELTLAQVAAKFDIPVEKLRIKE